MGVVKRGEVYWVRTIDKARLLGKMGEIDQTFWHSVLLEMLA